MDNGMKKITAIFLDIGNTNVNFSFNDKIGEVFSISTKSLSVRSSAFNFLKKYLPTKVVISSVVPIVSDLLAECCYEVGIDCKILSFEDINLQTTLENNNELGIDRAINAFYSMKKFGDSIIIDFGTALTFDIILNRVYQGGMIFPGMNTAMHNLHIKTAKLPHIKIKEFQSGIGKNTTQAISFGMAIGYEGVLKNTIFFIERYYQSTFKIIFTGGSGKMFYNLIDGAIFEENLILEYLVKEYGDLQ